MVLKRMLRLERLKVKEICKRVETIAARTERVSKPMISTR